MAVYLLPEILCRNSALRGNLVKSLIGPSWSAQLTLLSDGQQTFVLACAAKVLLRVLRNGSGYGGLCPHPLGKLSFPRPFLLLPRFCNANCAAKTNTAPDGLRIWPSGASYYTKLYQKRTAESEQPSRLRAIRSR